MLVRRFILVLSMECPVVGRSLNRMLPQNLPSRLRRKNNVPDASRFSFSYVCLWLSYRHGIELV